LQILLVPKSRKFTEKNCRCTRLLESVQVMPRTWQFDLFLWSAKALFVDSWVIAMALALTRLTPRLQTVNESRKC